MLALVTPLVALLVAAEPAEAPLPPEPASAEPVTAAPEAAAPDWMVPAAHAGGFLLGMRVTVSALWPDAYDPTRWSEERAQLKLAYTRPPDFRRDRMLFESDGDPWWLNGFGHAFFGSEIYGRTRQCGGSPLAAFLATTATSVAWEYGLEALHKRPSAVDLVWTPLSGVLLGEGRFRLQRWLRSRDPRSILLYFVDPLGELERRLFGTRC